MVLVVGATGQVNRFRVSVRRKATGRNDGIGPTGVLRERVYAGVHHSACDINPEIGQRLVSLCDDEWWVISDPLVDEEDDPTNEGDYE
jgi:hypothetical protein